MKKIEQVKALKAGDVVEVNTRYGGAMKMKIEKVTDKMVFYRWILESGVSGNVMKSTHESIARTMAA